MIFGALIFFVFGTLVGSFLNVLILRLPEDQKITGRSHCVHCKHVLAPKDLVPFFSFIFLRGECAYCGKPISKRYFLVESITAVLFALTFLTLGANLYSITFGFDAVTVLQLLRALFIISVLVVIFAIDLEHYLILDEVVFPSTVVLFFLNLALDFAQHQTLFGSSALRGLLGGAGLCLFFVGIYYVSERRGLGFGDVKLTFFLGLATPFPLLIPNIFFSFLFGSVIGIFLILLKGKHLGTKIPFAVFLTSSTFVTLLYGEALLHWYLNLIYWR